MENKKVVKNASWIIGVQILRSLISIVISMLTARFLGPSNYGLINYAASIVSFVTPIMYLGLTGILVQEIINNPDDEGKTTGTAIALSFTSSLLCILGVIVFVYFVNAGETETLIVCFLYSLLLIFQSIDLIQYWFQAKLLSKYSSIASFIAYFIVALYKVYLLASGKGVFWFAVSNAIDYFIIAILLIVFYKKQGGAKLSFSFNVAGRMLSRSKYYILSNLMITVFGQTDKIMLKLMVNDAATGYYAAAATCAGMTYFVFSAIIDSVRPMIFDYKKENDIEMYEKSIICLYCIVIYLSLIQSVVFTVASPLIIRILYGEGYVESIPVLQVIVWYSTFSYLGGARDIWILAEGKQRHLIVINLVGAVLNVALNFVLIPYISAMGAAIATVITQFFINGVFIFIYKPTRRNAILQFKAFNPKYLLLVLKKVKGSKV